MSKFYYHYCLLTASCKADTQALMDCDSQRENRNTNRGLNK